MRDGRTSSIVRVRVRTALHATQQETIDGAASCQTGLKEGGERGAVHDHAVQCCRCPHPGLTAPALASIGRAYCKAPGSTNSKHGQQQLHLRRQLGTVPVRHRSTDAVAQQLAFLMMHYPVCDLSFISLTCIMPGTDRKRVLRPSRARAVPRSQRMNRVNDGAC